MEQTIGPNTFPELIHPEAAFTPRALSDDLLAGVAPSPSAEDHFYIFKRQAEGRWALEADLSMATVPTLPDAFDSVGVGQFADDRLAIGISGSPGGVYIFARHNGNWGLSTVIGPDDLSRSFSAPELDGEDFASGSLAFDGNRLAFGNSNAQQIFVFDRDGSSWASQQEISGDTFPRIEAESEQDRRFIGSSSGPSW